MAAIRIKPNSNTLPFLSVFFLLLFTLANPAGFALAQTRRVLIAEKIDKPEKTKTFSEGDKLTLRSYNTGNRHSGRITAFSDSSLVLEETEFLFSDIQYIEGRTKVPDHQKKIGLIFISASLVMMGTNLFSFSANDNLFPMILVIPSVAVFGTFLLVHKPMGAISPQNGWQLRVKYVE